jgi:anti-sigma factor RsiW
MKDPTLIGPCADHEHDLMDLHDGDLPPERARHLRLHLERCARCSAWAAGFAEIDAQLATVIAAPALSPGFDARLRERIASLRASPDVARLRAGLEREHDELVQSLRSGARLRAVLGATASVATTLGLLTAAPRMLERGLDMLPAMNGDFDPLVALGALAVAVCAAALGWSASRGGLALPGLRS